MVKPQLPITLIIQTLEASKSTDQNTNMGMRSIGLIPRPLHTQEKWSGAPSPMYVAQAEVNYIVS